MKDGRLVTYPELAGEAVGSLPKTERNRVGEHHHDSKRAPLRDSQRGSVRHARTSRQRYATAPSSISDVLSVNEAPLLIAAMSGGVMQLASCTTV